MAKKLVEDFGAIERNIRENEQKLDKARIKNQCNCNHLDKNSGEPAIRLAKNLKNGEKPARDLYRCSNCGKLIRLSEVTMADFESSVNTINTVCDVAKINMANDWKKDPKVERERRRIIKTQYYLQTRGGLWIKGVLKTVDRNKKRNKYERKNASNNWV